MAFNMSNLFGEIFLGTTIFSLYRLFFFLFQLTPTTLGSLHQLITYLGESSDYQNAMLFYNSMVSGPSFSEIAAFAPTIKILIQQAIQLQIVW